MHASNSWECLDDGCWSSSRRIGAKKCIEMENGWPIGRRTRARLIRRAELVSCHGTTFLSIEKQPMTLTLTRHTVRVNGIRMHVAEAGKGAPVVLLHGYPETRYAWRN